MNANQHSMLGLHEMICQADASSERYLPELRREASIHAVKDPALIIRHGRAWWSLVAACMAWVVDATT